jgi:protein SCO1/2
MTLLAAAPAPSRVFGHVAFGPVNPALDVPAMALATTSGRSTNLAALLQGRVTALQLMFTGCSATCPIQGAVFAQAQHELDGAPPLLQLLSVSIDPLGDDVAALRIWLQRFGARPQRWNAALPRPQDVDRLLDFVRGRADSVDRHVPAAYIFDRRARLAYRTQDMPAASHLVALMHSIAQR